jgi:hypothetical protein
MQRNAGQCRVPVWCVPPLFLRLLFLQQSYFLLTNQVVLQSAVSRTKKIQCCAKHVGTQFRCQDTSFRNTVKDATIRRQKH